MKNNYLIKAVSALILIAAIGVSPSCNKKITDDPDPTPPGEKAMEDLIIPEDFNFETNQIIELVFQDNLKAGDTAKYDVYIYSEQVTPDSISNDITDEGEVLDDEVIELPDGINDLIASKVSETGLFTLILSLPLYVEKLYVIKNTMGVYSSEIIDVAGKKAVFQSQGYKTTADDPVDVLYGVNGAKELFTINPVTGELVVIEIMPIPSFTCAVDKVNRILYTVSANRPYPLYSYDLDEGTFKRIRNIGYYGPRLDYDYQTGRLLYSNSNWVLGIDPTTGRRMTVRYIDGLEINYGGDIIVGPDEVTYMTTHGGLYRLNDNINGSRYTATRISAETLPYAPTSTTFDSNGELWLATNGAPARLFVMDKETGGWEYRFDPYQRGIHDLTTLPLDETTIDDTDTDGDGIIDFYDEYPNDAGKAYNTYTPSIYGVGAHAFEDNWPDQGDYDFNDLVVNYHFTIVANADDDIVEVRAKYKIKHIGASYHNGFGVQLPFSADLIANVTGYHHTTGLITVDGKGLETGQNLPVIIVTDDANADAYQTLDILIELVSPTDPAVISAPPFNPFIFIDGDRGREVHMPNYIPTNLVNTSYYGTGDDNSIPVAGRYYKTLTNLPWGININHDYKVPLERYAINQGYLKFAAWAESGGTQYQDWYKDNSGYRDESKLKN
ncbi:MAG: LruC domain-containing protein [Bacteroidota bacterium]